MTKKVIKEMMLFTVIAVVLLVSLGLLFNSLSPIYSPEKIRIEKMIEKADSIEAIAIGNSIGCAIDFNVLGLKGYHLWIGGLDMFETKIYLETVLPLLPNLKTVFIPVTTHSFKQENNLVPVTSGLRRKFYSVISFSKPFTVIHGDIKNLLLSKLSPIIRHDHLESVFYAAVDLLSGKKINTKEDPSSDGYVNENGFIGPQYNQILNRDSIIYKAERHIRLTEIMSAKNKNIESDIYDNISKMIKMARNRNIRIVLYTPPSSEVYYNVLLKNDPETIDRMFSYMKKLQNEYKVEYYNFADDSRFVSRDSLFSNENHLNSNGAAEFSLLLKQLMY